MDASVRSCCNDGFALGLESLRGEAASAAWTFCLSTGDGSRAFRATAAEGAAWTFCLSTGDGSRAFRATAAEGAAT